MIFYTVLFWCLISPILAVVGQQVDPQHCGPKGGVDANGDYLTCQDGYCCSAWGWCGTSSVHCDSGNCIEEFSGLGSACKKDLQTTATLAVEHPSTFTVKHPSTFTVKQKTVATEIPAIDHCGAPDKLSCPGAGVEGYFYRCCSQNGHCGPKNDIQDQSDYCGNGCQHAFGDCSSHSTPPISPGPITTVGEGKTCGPIVNAACGNGLCCSGSNFCGSGEDFCGSANWCQSKWGACWSEQPPTTDGQSNAAEDGHAATVTYAHASAVHNGHAEATQYAEPGTAETGESDAEYDEADTAGYGAVQAGAVPYNHASAAQCG